MADAAGGINRYPDFAATVLSALIAERVDASVEAIALGTGSVALLQHALEIMCDDGDEVIYAWRSFEAYPIVTRITGAVPVEVPLTADHRHDLAAMAKAVNERTRVIILCSPNNPTGTVVEPVELEAFMRDVPSDVLVILDEAYVEFVDEHRRADAVGLVHAHRNLCVLRTFSKAYGLAGVRLGYAIADHDVADALRAVSTPFGISSPAQAAGSAVLAPAAADELASRIAYLRAERHRVIDALGDFAAADPQGNFIWCPLAERAEDFAQVCAVNGLSVRAFAGEGVRATIAETPANDRLIALAQEFDRS